jgi:hypothetical protein
MITVHSEGKHLVPLVLCDACGEQIKGEGWMWTLAPADGQSRRGDVFFSHDMCHNRFDADNDPPPGWRWARADIHQFLSLLADNTGTDTDKLFRKWPIVRGPTLH